MRNLSAGYSFLMGTLSAKLRSNNTHRNAMDFARVGILYRKIAPTGRKAGGRWIVAASTLPLFGVLAAFGTAPDTLTQDIATEQVTKLVSLPDVVLLPDGDDLFWRQERVRRGDTVASVLARLQVSDPAAIEYLRQSKDARALFQLTPGRAIQAHAAESGALIGLRYRTGVDRQLVVAREEETFSAASEPAVLEQRLVMKSGTIASSLFAATDDADVPDAVADQLLKMFSSDIDFHKDLRKGDRFAVLYEVQFVDGEPVRSGRLMAAEFINNGKSHRAVWFEGEKGKGAYYTPDGKSLRKAFLRSPIEFSRITSGFSQARFHPVLQSVRAHRGVDYAAPVGTRVLAAADGTVSFVGQQSGYGNVVVIEHRDGHSTLYGHLSGFGSGLRKGRRVEQGEVIGYVGMTGLATGPHLHYEFRVNGEHQDPLLLATPEGVPVTTELQAAFEAKAKPLAQTLALLRGVNLARLE